MSTKTTFKRIALVAVAALGLGVLTSVAPATAASTDVTAISAGTSAPARVGIASGTTALTLTHRAQSEAYVLSAQITSAPATSTKAVLAFTAGTGVTATVTDTATVTGSTLSPLDTTGVAYADVSGTGTTGSSSMLLAITPDVAGTYQILVTVGGSASTGFSAGLRSVVYSVTTVGAPASMAISSVGRVVEGAPANFGANVQVSFKDSNGLATILGLNEAVNVTTSNTTTTSLTDCAGNARSTLASPSATGVYSFCVEDGTIEANGTAVITLTGSGLLAPTFTSNTTVSVINTTTAGTTQATLKSSTGYAGTTPTFYTAAKSSHTYTFAATVTEDTTYGIVVDATGTGSRDYATSITVPAADDTVDFTIAQAFSSTGVTALSVGSVAAGSAVANPIVINREAAVANKIAVEGQSALLLPTGGSAKLTVSVKDQFGNAVANTAVSVSASGRTTVASTGIGVTDANGLISYTFTDAGTTGTSNTVTFNATLTTPAGSQVAATANGNASFTITYGTVTVDSVTVSGGSKAETVAGSTPTVIKAGDNGPEGSYVGIKAVVKDANGNLLAGVPVTFTVDSGAIVKTAAIDYAIVYTGTDGSATTRVFDWKVGKQTITATAGGKSSTDYLNWVATDATSARVLSATATGDIVSLKVVDRFGNAVKGVTIDLSRTGSGLFGSGKSTDTATTDKNGTADIRFIGSGTVVAELGSTYAQAYDKAGEIAETAVTAAVAGTTKGTGASFAPAGVAKVSVEIAAGANAGEAAANAAADAAAEATDAANAATDAANAAAEAADAATAAAQDAADAVAALSTQVSEMVNALKKQITALTNLVIKIQKKVKA